MPLCKFCHQEPILHEESGLFYPYENRIVIASGNYTELSIGVNINGETVMRACGEDYSNDYRPKFCPECGRSLDGPDTMTAAERDGILAALLPRVKGRCMFCSHNIDAPWTLSPECKKCIRASGLIYLPDRWEVVTAKEDGDEA